MSERQHSLFDTEPAPWQIDAAQTQLVATVVLPKGPHGEYDYLIPTNMQSDAPLEERLEVGRRVEIPFGRGNQTREGYCIRIEHKPAGKRRLKAISNVLDTRQLLTPSMLRLTEWIADYYLCPLGLVLETVLPAGVRHQAGTRTISLWAPSKKALSQIKTIKLGPKQKSVLEWLVQAGRPLTLQQITIAAECTEGPIRSLAKAGLLVQTRERAQIFAGERDSTGTVLKEIARQSPKELTEDQQVAHDTLHKALHAEAYQTILVHGVTGSGKTEVYIQAIEEAVRFGRQAIVLVPEISLTPQTVSRFRARFDTVAVLHSHQTPSERHWHWKQIADGKIQVVVGARSAIFAPTPNLGLIVIDEEHENTFKQDTAPRYDARNVARKRAETEKVPLVLGSATPSLDSWARADSGEFTYVKMPRRIMNRPLPAVKIVDIREQRSSQPFRGSISRILNQAMAEALNDNGKVMLLLNRRGFSTQIQCPSCGDVVACPDCEIPMTFHREGEYAICHYCDYQIPAPNACPSCNYEGIRFQGTGTQKLEAEVRARFPKYRCIRMDTDTMRKAGSHEKALAEFEHGNTQILLGTQMIAKGLDFAAVTLVGVIYADTALHFPDFRAAERTFQLLTQVAGRTGRGEAGGRVIVQTLSPDHPAIRAAALHDYAAFSQTELPTRKALGYPPYGSVLRVVVRGESLPNTKGLAEAIADGVRATAESEQMTISVLGPAPAPFAKLRGEYRFQVLLRGPNGDHLREAIIAITDGLNVPDKVRWMADVDPVDMM